MNQVKKELVPKLRFKEFEKDGEWSQELGSALFDSISNKKHKSDLPILAITQEHGAIPRDKIDYRVSVTEKSIESYKVVEVGDFIISLRSFQGGIEYSTYKGLCSPAYIILRGKRNDRKDFFRYYFKTSGFIEDLNHDIEGIRDGKMVSYEQFSKIIIPLPKSKIEQQKIADCLSSLDELIEAQDKKLEALQRHKKGLMQDLFPAEGETLPRLRFPEFQSAPEWEAKPLGHLIETLTPPKKIPNSQYALKGSIPIIDQSQSLIAGWTDDDESLINKNFPLIIFGDHTCVLKISFNAFAQGADGIKIFSGSSEIMTEYLFQFLHSNPLKMEEYKRHFSILKEKKISYPIKESGEQKRIADFLSSIDDLITNQTKKLESLRLHKKGLMQQLFPNISEAQ